MGRAQTPLIAAGVALLMVVGLPPAVPREADVEPVSVTNMDTEVRSERLRWDAGPTADGGTASKVVFRYRADELNGATGSLSGDTVVPLSKVGGASVSVQARSVKPFRDFKYVSLDGVDDAIVGQS